MQGCKHGWLLGLILSVISCTVKEKCILGLWKRIGNVVISSCKIPFLFTDFPVLHICFLWWAPRTRSKCIYGLLKKKCWPYWSRRDSRRLIWVGCAAFLLFQVTSELVVFIVVYRDRHWSVRSVSCAWDCAVIICGGLAQLTIIVQQVNLILYFVKTIDKFGLSSQNSCCCILMKLLLHHVLRQLFEFFSGVLVRLISRDKVWKLFLCWLVFSNRLSWHSSWQFLSL